ncbi:4Fe-4S binding protein [Desulfatitalea alkaliphila]|uniref:4Fe-4S binding protein n=1 Tax=Desulfatitalea alkaliphila TaxID=2929485 RepID=A0AA41R6M3_9BACT|nr:4Fe-4S binding protein [Desulfatitalea alkaliphila]MCJ8501896.1 4Fe-4S binding protein [Desulfatitalea alkaliphila]
MSILTARRITQLFFFALFLWFCIVTTLGERWWQLRGWPVNWLLELNPLTGLGVLLATRTVYAGLLWGVVTIALTLVLGRFFCGWVCPFGALQQAVGYLGKRGLNRARKIARNRPHPAQRIKYWLLLFMLAAAAAGMLRWVLESARHGGWWFWALLVALPAVLALLAALRVVRLRRDAAWAAGGALALGLLLEWLLPRGGWLVPSLQTGLLDPIALVHRSVNLVLLPLADGPLKVTAALPRVYPGAALIGMFFLLFTLLSLRVPRFYCRFICPLGALFGLLARWSVWRIGKGQTPCTDCRRCEADCEGACTPTEALITSECVLCLNCLDACRHGIMGYRLQTSAAGEQLLPDLQRRQVVTAIATGLVAAPLLRLDGMAGADWNPAVIRPPGALDEAAFLARCIKCGQCMRVCPTNVVHPATLQSGLEGLWTPMLNFRVGTSGCQFNCVACSRVCPTAALRPISVAERMGTGAYAEEGPLRIGMAFVDHGRCLPWAMDTPCIVCQENCPVSPKAIFTRDVLQPVRDGAFALHAVNGDRLSAADADWVPGRFATGDYFCRVDQMAPRPIVANTERSLTLGDPAAWPQHPAAGRSAEILVRLQQPYVDPHRCIGCGVCEHECPVQGRRAIRVTAENESRNRAHRLTT